MMNLKDAERDFRETKKILDNLKIEFFLVGGTALFAYRDNEFSGGYNRSLGIGIFGTKQHKTIRSKLLENGNLVIIVERNFFQAGCHLIRLFLCVGLFTKSLVFLIPN